MRGLAIVSFLFVVGGFQHSLSGQNQKKQEQNKKELAESEKDQKIRLLEERVERLEEIVFATLKISVAEAERQVARARQQLEYSERLFIRGMLTESRVNQDRLALRLAERELQFAKSSNQSRQLSAEIDLLRAKNKLRVAQDNFRLSERRANKGLSSANDLELDRKAITIAERRVELAQKRLDAIKAAPKPKDKSKDLKPKSEKTDEAKKK